MEGTLEVLNVGAGTSVAMVVWREHAVVVRRSWHLRNAMVRMELGIIRFTTAVRSAGSTIAQAGEAMRRFAVAWRAIRDREEGRMFSIWRGP